MNSKAIQKFKHLPLNNDGPQECALTGSALLNTPYFNKGSAFPADERKTFNLTGLLPTKINTLDQQVKRAYEQYSSQPDDLTKNTFMTSMKEQNEVLYYKVSSEVISHRGDQEWLMSVIAHSGTPERDVQCYLYPN